jgi:ankyrin repeat protein
VRNEARGSRTPQRGAHVNARITYGTGLDDLIANTTALRFAAERGDLGVVETLLAAGADPNIQDMIAADSLPQILAKPGATALVMAETAAITARLLSHGANPNVVGWHGHTALMQAAKLGRLDQCLVLLRHGADKALRDDNGKTAADVAASNGHKDVAKAIDAWNPAGNVTQKDPSAN